MMKSDFSEPESRERDDDAALSSAVEPDRRVLAIEDEKRMADLLKTGLEEYGYTVTVAYDGAMGSRLAKNLPLT